MVVAVRNPVTGAHVRRAETTTIRSIVSPDASEIIEFLADRLRACGYEVLLDHDYTDPDDDT